MAHRNTVKYFQVPAANVLKWLCIAVLVVTVIAGCNGTSSGAGSTVEATASIQGALAVVSGGSQTVSVTFNSDNKHSVRFLTVTSGLGDLPAGWSGPQTFSCTTVSTGNGCLLNLQFVPTTATSGSVNLGYSYIDDEDVSGTGSVAIPYGSTTSNNVVGTASPAGQVATILGTGSQNVGVTFTTDDGNPATGLTLTSDLGSLPAGWSGPQSFECAAVSTGNGCQLPLTYAPTAVGSGALTLSYSFKDNSGTSKTGTILIPYVTTAHDNIAVAVAPAGQVAAVLGRGTQSVGITFTTDDGNPASALTVSTDLGSLPSGWSMAGSTGGFSCASVSTGNGCQLTLTYAPTMVDSGVLTLNYSYADNSGSAKTGSVNIPYVSTSQNNVSVSQLPSGQVAVVTGASQPVTLTFTTDDGNPASALSLTTDLSALPSVWTAGTPAFSCPTVSTGGGCALTLTYAPTSVGSGSLNLAYGYKDNSGTIKTGSVSVAYVATAHDNVVSTASVAGTAHTITGGSVPVNVTFTTDDGNPASNLVLTTSLTTLPTGWSSTDTTFSCGSVSSGNACQLPLTFAPSSAGSGTLTLSFSYSDNAGTAKTGSVSIPYLATLPLHLYTANWSSGTVSVCPLAADGSVGTCQTAASGLTDPASIAIHGSYAYIAEYLSSTVKVCQIQADATFTNCVDSGSNVSLALGIAVNSAGTLAYTTSYNQQPAVCPINMNGLLGACSNLTGAHDETWDVALSSDGAYAFLSSPYYGDLEVCAVATDGTFSGCTANGMSAGTFGLAVNGNDLYLGEISGGQVLVCQPDGTGSPGACQTAGTGFNGPVAVAIGGQWAYVTNLYDNTVSVCPLNADGTFATCTVAADASFNSIYGVAVH
jgi:hypothetical protein